MKKNCFIIVFLLLSISVTSQVNNPYRYENDFLPAEFYKGNRATLRNQMPENSMAIIFSAAVKNFSNDVNYSFHQSPNFYYLTGFTESNSVLIIFKSPTLIGGVTTDELLFVKSRNIDNERWTGRLAGIEEAAKITGIQNVLNSYSFDSLNLNLTGFNKILYLSFPTGVVDDRNDSCDLSDLIASFKRKTSFPPSNGDSYLLGKTLNAMREVKQPGEIGLLKKAITLSCTGHIEMMKALEPGMSEYQTEAVGEYVFRNSGAEDVGYPSICGGEENSCILHYETNRRHLKAGELILLDMGGEYHGYTADITRTLPVNGTFSQNQKIIYNLVLAAHDSAFAQCKPGNGFRDPHKAAVRVIQKGLIDLGIIKNEKQYSTYFMHGTSHYLGLDVHDAGTFGNLKDGNVITVEPGIYIPENSDCDPKWWNIGIRIEDDVLITSNGYENLSASAPVKPDEIEKVMKQQPDFVVPLK